VTLWHTLSRSTLGKQTGGFRVSQRQLLLLDAAKHKPKSRIHQESDYLELGPRGQSQRHLGSDSHWG
jgi:hypothetical protein